MLASDGKNFAVDDYCRPLALPQADPAAAEFIKSKEFRLLWRRVLNANEPNYLAAQKKVAFNQAMLFAIQQGYEQFLKE